MKAMNKAILFAVTCATLAASSAVTITDVSARQRWPWNGLVDVDFTINGAAAGEAFAIDIDATAASGATQLSAKTYVTEPVAGNGDSRLVWDLGTDYPNFRANDLRISVTATPISSDKAIYMVIDLSGGSTATKYPVRYTTKAPAHVQGAVNEPCQTTELWMRRIAAPKTPFPVLYFKTANYSGDAFYARLTQDYYIGVFELTQKQYNLIAETWPSHFSNSEYRDSRPVETLPFNTFTGTWEDSNAMPEEIAASSPLGLLRSKSGLPINVPTLAQLQYAVMGGTTPIGSEAYTYCVNGTTAELVTIARCPSNRETTSTDAGVDTKSATASVGSYLPNDYGLYDLIGNVWELTSSPKPSTNWNVYYKTKSGDETLGATAENPVVNPKGCAVSEASAQNNRFIYGGAYDDCSSPAIFRSGSKVNANDWRSWTIGYRLSMTVE